MPAVVAGDKLGREPLSGLNRRAGAVIHREHHLAERTPNTRPLVEVVGWLADIHSMFKRSEY